MYNYSITNKGTVVLVLYMPFTVKKTVLFAAITRRF